jgi:hypothetical protein
MNVFQLNKLSKLHNGKNIFFTKTDYLMDDFKTIEQLNNDVILISGNSDFCITDYHLSNLPNNVKFWYAQNAIVSHPKIINIPLGIENFKSSIRENHGIGYERANIKENFILNHNSKKPSELIYSNFTIGTNTRHRTFIKNICVETPHIIWEEPNLSVENFFNRVLDFTSVVCAQGNGDGDNYRIYETLYLNRIPITFNRQLYNLLHHKFPIICLDDPLLLKNYNFMREQIGTAKLKIWDKNLLDLDYWKSKILSLI